MSIILLFTARAKSKAKEGVTEGWFAKFPKDVIYCEQLTNGNPNILNEEPFVEKKKEKVDYSLIFGDPEEIQQKKEDINQKSVIRKMKAREERGTVSSPKAITHPRFLGRSDHTVRILTQPSTPFHLARGEKTPASPAAQSYTCSVCDFATARVNVMLLHNKSHSAPEKTNLANYARSRPSTETKPRLSEVKGTRLFADAKANLASKRKLVQSPRVNHTEPSPKKSKVVKKPKVTKKEKEEREEKKNAIFGDWSEDENEEEEERLQLKESIESLFSNEEESDEEFFQFKTNQQLDSENSRAKASRSLRQRKTAEGNKKKRKSKKKLSAAAAVSSLIKSSLDSPTVSEDNEDFYSDRGEESEEGTPPASPPPTTPSKKPVILKKSSTRSFQMPSRPDGKLELIKHGSTETKYAGISAKAKAKQLARTQLNKDELFDKLIETEVSPKKESKLKLEEGKKNESVIDTKVEEPSEKERPLEAESSPVPETPQKKIETYDFECDSEATEPPSTSSDLTSKEQLSKAVDDPSPSKSPVSSPVTSVTKIVVKSPQQKKEKEKDPKPEVTSPVRSPGLAKTRMIVNKTTVVGTTKLISPPRIVTVQSSKVKTSPVCPTKILVESPKTSPVKSAGLTTVTKVTLDATKKSPPLLLQKKTSPLIQKKPVVLDTEKPVVAGVTKIIGQPSKNIVLSKPINSSVNNSASPLKLGSQLVTLSEKQDASINSLPSITLSNQRKQPGSEKPLTISLESKRSTTIKPIVKTVDIPKRVSKLKDDLGGGSKPVVHLDKKEKTKAPSLEIKLDTKPAVKAPEAAVVVQPEKPTGLVVEAETVGGVNGAKLSAGETGESAVNIQAGGLQLLSEQGIPVVAEGEGDMIYLLVDDGTDPNLENQTLYIDPSQLAAATGGVILDNDGSVPMLLQAGNNGEQLVLQADGLGSNLVILEDKVR